MTEIIKRDAKEFGGLQFGHLALHELAYRMCAFRGCGFPARVQMGQPRLNSAEPQSYRAFCSQHFVQIVFLTAAFLGDPSPASEAQRFADFLAVSGEPFANWRESIALVFNPEFARCAKCGGGFVAETIGMFSGKRYVHTCGVPK